MPTIAPDDRSAKIEAFRRQFAERVWNDAVAIKVLINPVDSAGILALRSLCHLLKGSASLFGLTDLSVDAVVLHREIHEHPENRRSIIAKWDELFERIKQLAPMAL